MNYAVLSIDLADFYRLYQVQRKEKVKADNSRNS